MTLNCVVGCSSHGPPPSSPPLPRLNHLPSSLSTIFKQIVTRADVSKAIRNASQSLLNGFADSTFRFMDQPRLPSQRNFAPVEEIEEAVEITNIEGEIPADFPEGVYIRNGSNPLFGALQTASSVFGESSNIWVEGEGMLHALYFSRLSDNNDLQCWQISYNNRYVESETFKIEKSRGRPVFLPAIEGHSAAVLAAYAFNQLRFGKANKYISNTNIFEHAGRLFAISENHIPQEIDLHSLRTYGNWDVGGAWNRPFTAHPKKAPVSGELVITGVDPIKPFLVVGVISADGKNLMHKVDVKLERCIICHDIGVTEKYNIIMDLPLTIDMSRLIRGGPLIKFEKNGYARIGVMPRYGDADSIRWFETTPCVVFHLVNCYEDGDEVVVRGCRALESIIPGPDFGLDKFAWFSRRFKTCLTTNEHNNPAENPSSCIYEWRLNMKTGSAKERFLTGPDYPVELPMINDQKTGFFNRFAYAQLVDLPASSECALPKYGALAKFDLTQENSRGSKVEIHSLGLNQFCSGAAFVQKPGSHDEDDGWIITFVHNENTDVSQVNIIEVKNFEKEPVVKITLPQRVPYGFHGTFIKKRA